MALVGYGLENLGSMVSPGTGQQLSCTQSVELGS